MEYDASKVADLSAILLKQGPTMYNFLNIFQNI